MTSQIELRFKLLTGRIESIQISRAATVLDAKRQLHTKLSDAPPHRQKLILTGLGTILEDGRTLSSYPQINSGTTIGVIIQLPWKIYVQDPTSKIYEVEIPSSEPLKYFISDLRALIESTMRQKLDNYQMQFKDTTINDTVHGKKLTIQDWGIDKEDTIFLMKHGQSSLCINEPQVDICFLMDCTGSMGSWIESVKNNIKNVSDELDKQYRGCDLKFAFVRYTDYDRPESTRTTWIDFTKSLPQFHGFVNPIRADGGGDGPEDIMGGLKVACSRLSWRKEAAKVLIHIADCPCHGNWYHTLSDDYPNGDPAGITHDQMMSEIARLDLQYWFGYIQRENTDEMIDIFNESLKARSSHRLIIRQFSAVDPAQLENAIYKSTTASVFANEARKMFGGGATASFDTQSLLRTNETLRNEMQKLSLNYDNLSKENDSVNEENHDLKSTLEQKNTCIRQMKKENGELKRKYDALNNEIKEKDKEIKEKDSEIEDKNKWLLYMYIIIIIMVCLWNCCNLISWLQHR